MPNVKIRIADDNDFEQLIELTMMLEDYHHRLDKYYKSGKEIEAYIRQDLADTIHDENTLILVAESNNKIIGYLNAGIQISKPFISHEKIGFIYDCFVMPEYRSKGTMNKFISKTKTWFKSKGIKWLELKANLKNKTGLNVWHKIGFKPFVYNMGMKL